VSMWCFIRHVISARDGGSSSRAVASHRTLPPTSRSSHIARHTSWTTYAATEHKSRSLPRLGRARAWKPPSPGGPTSPPSSISIFSKPSFST